MIAIFFSPGLIKDNVSLFNDQSLYQVLNFEEREEEKAKENMKVFHNLNYFNKRRKSVLLNLTSNSNIGSNCDSPKKNNDKKTTKNSLYKTSVLNMKEKSEDKNNSNLSHYLLKKNRLEIIEKDIRKEVNKRRKEDKKINLINEKTKNIVYDMSKESKSEIKRILDI